MQKFYVSAEDLHVTRDTLDAPDGQVREVYALDAMSGDFVVAGMPIKPRTGGYAAGEQE